MTTDEVKKVVKRKRPAVVVGIVAGVSLVVAYYLFPVLLAPSKPDLRQASAKEVIEFVASDRGLGRMAQVEQELYLNQWRELLVKDPQKLESLKATLGELKTPERKALLEAFFKHIKRGYLDDARRYKSLPPDEQYAFLADKVVEYEQRAEFMQGVASGMGPGDFGSPGDMKQWLLSHTTEDERELGLPYMEALAQVAVQLKKQRSANDASRTATVGDVAGSET